ASLRRADVQHLVRQLRGDLDWIVMKAIEKDRGRRYDTANALAMDLQRFLADEPVTARPPSAGYRLGKLVRRNRVAAIALGLVVVSVVAGGSLAVLGFVRARRAERQAKHEAQVAAKTSDFLVQLFAVSNPNVRDRGSITARELLDSGSARIEHELSTEPVVKSRLLRTMGKVYGSLGLLDRAEPLLRQALDLRRHTVPVDSAAVAESQLDLGSLLAERGAFAPAESAMTASLAIRERIAGLPDSVLAADNYELGRLAFMRADPTAAAVHARTAIDLLARGGDSATAFAMNAHNLLGITYVQRKQYDSAAAQFRSVIATMEPVLGLRNSTVLGAYNNLATAEKRMHRYVEAESLLVRVAPAVLDIYGKASTRYSTVLANLANIYSLQHRWHEAEPLYLEAIAIDDRTLDPQSPDRADDLAGLAGVYAGTGRLRAADSLYHLALVLQMKAYPADSPEIRQTRAAYAPVLRALGRTEAAAAMEVNHGR
ncbi:MAG TPA: tetratricopeptide repeat protein, partial [Gemmatimonadales bacterium]|nr:tetratricopeptide repeat protein [Gemmatimonadales bacterium]